MKIYYLNKLSLKQKLALCARPAINLTRVEKIVKPIIAQVKAVGDKALFELTKKFDGANLTSLAVSKKEFSEAEKNVAPELKRALKVAFKNITNFCLTQKQTQKKIKTAPGVTCWQRTRPIERVGLYVPGGTAPLPSTVLMLGIPAKLAGCKNIVLCTPPQPNGQINSAILYTAKLIGINNIYKVGGAQAIAAMAYGTQSISKVYKIFGPGNQFVTMAKQLVSTDLSGAAIDMPAGPSEVLVVADKYAQTDFVAADLLSQAEHGIDSQAVLVCVNKKQALRINKEVNRQLKSLPRKNIAKQALAKSFVLVVPSISEAINFANAYAPEHLILNIKQASKYLNKIINAGSVFVGKYSPEAAGDYASGPNHTLPTGGYARVYSGLGLTDYKKNITFQRLSALGAKNLGRTVSTIAQAEGLNAHKRAMQIRYLKKYD